MTAAERRARRATPRAVPAVVVALAAVAVLFFCLPLIGLIWRAPWSSAWAYLGDDATLDALRLSLLCSFAATFVAILFGLPLAWVLASVEFPGRRVVSALCTLSMVLPPVVAGVALFFSLGRRGFVGRYLYDWFGVQLPFTSTAVVIAQVFVAMPFYVVTVESALRQLDGKAEEAARTLGAPPLYTFRRITLPSIRPALIAGAALTWARALGEFGATVTFAGTFPGRTQTMPLEIYLSLQTNPQGAIVLALVLVAVSFAVLYTLRDRWLSPDSRRMRAAAAPIA